ncbi:MAG: BrnA antitoxin family protein [Cocleimonas sp.]|nr:BrnA antitoxin family protein [Cocleimonas sp.]
MKKIPTFASKKEEQAFWTTADSTEYIDWKKSKKVIQRCTPSLGQF